MIYPKPGRVKNKKVGAQARLPYCELCGQKAHGLPHHIESVGSGGPDHIYNQVQLCWGCHYVKIPGGTITKRQLFYVVAAREGVSIRTVLSTVKKLKNAALVQKKQ